MIDVSRRAQQEWAALPIQQRLRIFGRARHQLAAVADDFHALLDAQLTREPADTLVAEVIPLLEACRFLEREAEQILAPRVPGSRGRPWWLRGLQTRVERVPFGTVLVIAPGNYPLFLPGVQTLQALAAGNAVIWKPGAGGGRVAQFFAQQMTAAGLPAGLLTVTDESVEAADSAIAAGVDKVFFTGSATTGRKLLHRLADSLTPCVAELSGCDLVVVLPTAEMDRATRAIAFGMRLNGSATCMAPRRIFLAGLQQAAREQFLALLRERLAEVPPVPLRPEIAEQVRGLLDDSARRGAHVEGGLGAEGCRPALVTHAEPTMPIAQADIFAPVLSVIDLADARDVAGAQAVCPYALTATIFGDEKAALQIAAELHVGTVQVNDLIVPTADPRTPFTGRRHSGFGSTRGAEGLLEMTAPRVIAVRRSKSLREYAAPGEHHTSLFRGLIAVMHSSTWGERRRGLRQLFAAGRQMNSRG